MGEKHTPGPWKIFMFGGVQIGSAETSEAVCTMWGTEEEGQANAAFIVRAVNRDGAVDDLLTAIDWILRLYDAGEPVGGEAITRARAAAEKAREAGR